ncbi:MAG: carboxylesterase family protein [Streptosporangiaceae bacterium]|nr:carboxylesterase family protein [Streptosporangiaceae bacterium]
MMRRLTMWTAAVACVSASGLAGGVPAVAQANSAPLVVRTDKGLVRGIENGGVREFLGIPYAAPPVGALRWRPPRPAARWSGIRDASQPGSNCAQTGNITTGVVATSTAEDCLYLNVYAPPRFSFGPRPVMMWIHGGGFTGGAGSIYDGAPLAVTGNAVVVTINYRLGPFGFLALPSLDAESHDGSSGDYGLMDQQAALRWVQRNALAFGGDPRNVTIFGESAGGASVCDNMASPTAAGLFERAIAESGCFLLSQNQQQAEQHGASFAAQLGCTDPATAAACLRGKPADALLTAAGGVLGGWGPVIGGRTLPLQPATAFQTGRYAHVPLLQGTNHDEGRFFVGFEFDAIGHPMTAAQYPVVLAAQFGAADAAKVEARYPLSAYPSPDLAYASVFTDASFSCPALTADTFAARTGVYAYEFSDPSPPNDFGITFSFPLGAAHSTELQYVFGKIPFLDTTPPFTPAQAALSVQMMKYWTRFAATGNPNGGGGPFWPAFTTTRQQVQELIPAGIAPTTSFGADHQCAFWAQIEG